MKTVLRKDPYEGVRFSEIKGGEPFWNDGEVTLPRGLYLKIDSGESQFAARFEDGGSWAFKSDSKVFRVAAEELKFSIIRKGVA